MPGALLAAAILSATLAPDAGTGAAAVAPVVSLERVEAVLFGEEAPKEPRCAAAPDRASCLISLRYDADPAAAKRALELWTRLGSIAGVTPEHEMDGGFRGMVHLMPDLPVGPLRKHLDWVVAALEDHDLVLSGLAKDASRPLAYRWRALEVGFYRSVKKRTPAAYASDWTVQYNTNGTLNWGPDIVRELLFHEIFHLNDEAHRGWSYRTLTPIYGHIVDRCGVKKECLEPYAPVETSTRGGGVTTYYAFLPANGVGEYAAELAARFYREQRAAANGTKSVAFKCRTPENALAWSLMSSEFFGGVDHVPDCPAAK